MSYHQPGVANTIAMTMHFLWLVVLSTAIILDSPSVAFASGQGPGFTLKQWNSALVASGIESQRIYSILTFRDPESATHIAILSGSRTGWHVTVLQNVTSDLKVEWKSGRLADDFSVSSADALEIDDLGDEQAVEFSGCARHMCGGIDGEVFGMVLYAPRVKQAFIHRALQLRRAQTARHLRFVGLLEECNRCR